jgi:hypothetical protein
MLEIVKEYSYPNPLASNNEHVFSLGCIQNQIISDFFSQIHRISDSEKEDLPKYSLKEFKFEGDISTLDVLAEFVEKVK